MNTERARSIADYVAHRVFGGEPWTRAGESPARLRHLVMRMAAKHKNFLLAKKFRGPFEAAARKAFNAGAVSVDSLDTAIEHGEHAVLELCSDAILATQSAMQKSFESLLKDAYHASGTQAAKTLNSRLKAKPRLLGGPGSGPRPKGEKKDTGKATKIKAETVKEVPQVAYYHGTTEEVYASIKEHGLIPAESEGGDAWNQSTGKSNKVFLTRDLDVASTYAFMAAEQRGGTPAIVEVKVPSTHVGRLKDDLQSPEEDWSHTINAVPPGWISRVSKGGRPDTIHERGIFAPKWRKLEGEGTYRIFYTSILISGKSLRASAKGGPGVDDFEFDSTMENASTWAFKHAGEMVSGISETTRDRINDLVTTAFEDSLFDTLADDIAAILGDENGTRAELIAENETMEAINNGQRDSWSDAVDEGILLGTEKREWIASDTSCDACLDMDGQQADMDGTYDFDGDEIDGPPGHVRCGCTEGLVM